MNINLRTVTLVFPNKKLDEALRKFLSPRDYLSLKPPTVSLLGVKALDIVTVKSKFQIVIPQQVREQMHVEIGDILEAAVENGKITFTPKSLVDRDIAEGLQDAKAGRTHGPYTSAREAMKELKARAKHPHPK